MRAVAREVPTVDAGRRRCRLRRGALGAALGVAAGLVPALVRAAPPRCAVVVEDRAVLGRDLRCPGPALIVRNPRSVVELNGHTVESTRACSDEQRGAGIVVESTADGAQILGPGLIRGFDHGIVLEGNARVQVRDLRVSDSCTTALVVRGTDRTRARNLVLDRNGTAASGGAAVRVESSERFALEESLLVANGHARDDATVSLRDCQSCRVAGNRIVGNRGAGLRLDIESHETEVEHNVVLDQRGTDVVDEGNDNLFALNVFETGDGVARPSLWPLVPDPASPAPGIAGCGTMYTGIKPGQTATLACPQDHGLRALRNTVVAYRLLNPWNTALPMGAGCDPAEFVPATSEGGGALRCTNPNPVWNVVLEITCCLN